MERRGEKSSDYDTSSMPRYTSDSCTTNQVPQLDGLVTRGREENRRRGGREGTFGDVVCVAVEHSHALLRCLVPELNVFVPCHDAASKLILKKGG